MSNAAEDLHKVPEPRDGEVPSPEYIGQEAAQGKILCIGLDPIQVGQLIAISMVEQGQLTEEAIQNVNGSQLFIRNINGRNEVTLVLHGHNPFPLDGFKPSE